MTQRLSSLCLTLGLAFASVAEAAAPKAGSPAPGFELPELAAARRIVSLKSMAGKVVLVDFWASWCPPCILEIPHLGQLQKQYGRRGFQVVGISMDDSAAITKETMRNISFNYPVVLGDAKFGNLYGGVLGLPLQFLVGADGKILAIWSGDLPPATRDKAIAAALKKISPT